MRVKRVKRFLSTPSARRATRRRVVVGRWVGHFYPRPPRGGRLGWSAERSGPETISIHALREEGDDPNNIDDLYNSHFYPRPPRGGRPQHFASSDGFSRFLSTPSARRATSEISYPSARNKSFLSTPSARRATISILIQAGHLQFLSTPSARRATAKTEKNISAFVSL